MAERDRALAHGVAATWPPRGAVGGIAPSSFDVWSSLVDKVRGWIRAEAGPGRLLPWVPVAFGTGIAFYFTADHEPVLPATAVVALALCAARQAPASCQSTVISGERLRGQAGLALWRTRDGYTVAAIRPKERDRPWAPAALALAGPTEPDRTLAPRTAAPKPVDATPAEGDQLEED